jgi:glycosyltransferase involved in cell wall biosynthesis
VRAAPVPDVHAGPVAVLLSELRARAQSERASASLAADLAIRHRAESMRAVLAEGASGSSPALWWAALGRVDVALADGPEDLRAAAQSFDRAFATDPSLKLSRADAMARLHVYEETGRYDEIEDVPIAAGALEWRESELISMAGLAHRRGVESAEWLALANRVLMEPYGLVPFAITPGYGDPFDRVSTALAPGSERGPLISVVMTTFQRGETLRTAVRSVLEQTWGDWELILVDDCSGDEHEALLDEVEAADDRILVIRRPSNHGTYSARNLALVKARGAYITFQDDDDWSHPERLARQVSALRQDEQRVICLSYALHLTSQLEVRFGGRRTRVLGSSTMMLRTDVLRQVGGFDEVRKGGDTELIRRIEAVAPGSRVTLPEPLAFMRLTDNSLSRKEFRAGWVHPARAEYADASMAWHATLRAGDLESARIVHPRPFPVPDHILGVAAEEPRCFDVVVVGDFSEEFVYATPAADALQRALASGARVGIAHLDNPYRGNASERSSIASDVRALIDGERVRRVLPDDPAHARTVVVAGAELLQFAERAQWALEADRAVIVVDDRPAELSAGSRWSFSDALSVLDSMVRTLPHVRVAVLDGAAAEDLREAFPSLRIDHLEVAPPAFLRPIALAPAGAVPVIGFVSGHTAGEWDGESVALASAFPSRGEADVRVLRGSAPAGRADAGKRAEWLNFRGDEMPLPLFLQQVDVVVVAANEMRLRERSSSLRRLIGHATAHGRVVVALGELPEPLRGAAVAYQPGQVAVQVQALTNDHRAFERQLARARDVMAHEAHSGAVTWADVIGHGE